LLTLSCESREQVDGLVAKTVAAGGTADRAEDFGFMYAHRFADPDSHGWVVIYMSAIPA
jgi:predicted lactoylglutathione lyase